MSADLTRRAAHTVLVVDDERSYRLILTLNLERAGYRVVSASNGREALEAVERDAPDLIVLDLRLPDMEGEEVCRRVRTRATRADTPIIMLTARVEQNQKIRGLHAGADDYVTKPFDVDELLARIGAVLRRSLLRDRQVIDQDPLPAQQYRHGNLVVEPDVPRVLLDGKVVTCTPTEHRLLRLLVQQPGRVLVQEEILRRVWGPGYESDAALLHTAMWRLRRKIETDPRNPEHLLSLRGIGYSLAARDPAPLQ